MSSTLKRVESKVKSSWPRVPSSFAPKKLIQEIDISMLHTTPVQLQRLLTLSIFHKSGTVGFKMEFFHVKKKSACVFLDETIL